jgi:hypothetical protein
MKIISEPEKKSEILTHHNHFFKTMIKAVVDVKQSLIAIDAELHADLETLLLSERASDQADLWGFNLFLDKTKDQWIEFTSLINIRPSTDNPSMEVQKPELRKTIRTIVEKLIIE